MNALALLLFGLIGICGIGSLVCLIMVIVQMFKHDQTALGVVTIVLSFCGGFGSLIAFIFGWVKSGEWGIKKLMTVWSVLILSIILLYGAVIVMVGPQFMQQVEEAQRQQMQQIEQMQKKQMDQMKVPQPGDVPSGPVIDHPTPAPEPAPATEPTPTPTPEKETEK